jgi:hypothetical protein
MAMVMPALAAEVPRMKSAADAASRRCLGVMVRVLRGVKSHYTRMGRVGLREEMLKPHVGGAGVPAFCQTGKNAILNQHG